MSCLRSYLLPLLIFCFVSNAFAQISPRRAIIHFDPQNKPLEQVQINNTGSEVIHISAEVVEVKLPGTKGEIRESSKALVISPNRFTLAPSSSRSIRLLVTEPAEETQRVFRVSFLTKAKSPLSQKNESSKEDKDSPIQIKVLTSTGLLVFQNPKLPESQLEWKRVGNKIRVFNRGNIFALLQSLKLCETEEKNCDLRPLKKRIYGGASFDIAAPQGKSFELSYLSNSVGKTLRNP